MNERRFFDMKHSKKIFMPAVIEILLMNEDIILTSGNDSGFDGPEDPLQI